MSWSAFVCHLSIVVLNDPVPVIGTLPKSGDSHIYTARPKAYRLTNKPMTMSCICVVFEKPMVLRTKRLMCVRKVRCMRSIFWVGFAGSMLFIEVTCVCVPMIGIVTNGVSLRSNI